MNRSMKQPKNMRTLRGTISGPTVNRTVALPLTMDVREVSVGYGNFEKGIK